MKKLGFKAEDKGEKKETFEDVKKLMMDEVKHTLRPEFINRIDEIIVFHPLTATDLSSIVNLMLAKVGEKLAHFEVKLDASEEAKSSSSIMVPMWNTVPVRCAVPSRKKSKTRSPSSFCRRVSKRRKSSIWMPRMAS